MEGHRPIGPHRVREILKNPSSTLVVPLDTFSATDERGRTAGGVAFVVNGADRLGGSRAGANASGQANASGHVPDRPITGVRFPCGEAGFARLLGETAVGRGVEAEPFEESGTGHAAYRLIVPGDVLDWVADPLLLWRTLAGIYGTGQVETSFVSSEELTGSLLSARESLWHCRAGDVGWIIAESGDSDERHLQRGLQHLQELLRGIGLRDAEIRTERHPPSQAKPGARLLRLAGPEWVSYWPVPALNRFLARIVKTVSNADGTDSRVMQRIVAACICDRFVRADGIGAITTVAPRTPDERRHRYAVRTVGELIRTGGIVPRVFGETAYRSGEHYRALATVAAGLSQADRDRLRAALGRRRWQQLADHAEQGQGASLPWVAFSGACETLVRDLADRSRRPGAAPPSAVVDVVRRFYLEPRDARLREVWRSQIDGGGLARALEAALLSRLRPLLLRLPRETLVYAGCGESRDVQMRLSSAFSRQGRRMYLEDVAVLEARMERREQVEWDSLLAARLAVHAVARRAIGTGRAAGRKSASGTRSKGEARA